MLVVEFAHDVWAHWMRHFLKLDPSTEDIARWQRLAHTDYKDLTEREKTSDHAVAQKYGGSIIRRLLRLSAFLENLDDYGLDPKQVSLIRKHFEE